MLPLPDIVAKPQAPARPAEPRMILTDFPPYVNPATSASIPDDRQFLHARRFLIQIDLAHFAGQPTAPLALTRFLKLPDALLKKIYRDNALAAFDLARQNMA